jgi:hypothetical protein
LRRTPDCQILDTPLDLRFDLPHFVAKPGHAFRNSSFVKGSESCPDLTAFTIAE